MRARRFLTTCVFLIAISMHDARGEEKESLLNNENIIVNYLRGAELQAETNEQRREIRRTLEDLLRGGSKRCSSLIEKRYADYEGNLNKWNAFVLLQKYYVPEAPMALEPNVACRDLDAPEAKAALRETLESLHAADGS